MREYAVLVVFVGGEYAVLVVFASGEYVGVFGFSCFCQRRVCGSVQF